MPGHLPVTEFFHRASAAPAGVDKDITLCTQLDTLGLAFLPRLAAQWGGPLSVALYLMPWQTAVEVKAAMLADPRYAPVLKHADLHLVEADLAKALFPINALRNLAVDKARTNYVWVIEGDMLVPAGVRATLMRDHLPRMLRQPDVAWIVPLFENATAMRQNNDHADPNGRRVFHTKAELLAQPAWKPCAFDSHDFMLTDAYTGARTTDAWGGAWGTLTAPVPIALHVEHEPYYVVDRRATTRYDPRLGWLHWSFGYGPNADKVSQVRAQRRLTRFMLLPDVFLLRYHGWDRQGLQSFKAVWSASHADTPFHARRYATFRDPDRACQLHHAMDAHVCM